MRRFHPLAAAALLTVGVCASAAQQATVNLDGSVNAASAKAAKPPTLAASAARQIGQASAPTAKEAAAADLRKRKVHLKAERQNLKGDDAKRALQQRQNPSTFDRDMANGNIDHTEQVTDLKITVKK